MTRILIAEDEERIVSFLEKGLRAGGYMISSSSRGGPCHTYRDDPICGPCSIAAIGRDQRPTRFERLAKEFAEHRLGVTVASGMTGPD